VGVANCLEKLQRDFLREVLEMSLNSTWLIGLRFVHQRFFFFLGGGVRSEKYDSV
jgi:hypothetical protein